MKEEDEPEQEAHMSNDDAELVRENRYDPVTGVTMPRPGPGRLVSHAGVLRCRSCGSLLLSGDEGLHERLHPPASCGQAHPQYGVAHLKPHAWEEQFR